MSQKNTWVKLFSSSCAIFSPNRVKKLHTVLSCWNWWLLHYFLSLWELEEVKLVAVVKEEFHLSRCCWLLYLKIMILSGENYTNAQRWEFTLTCQIILQQILLFFGEKNTYTTLLRPISLLISDIFPSKPDFHLHKWEKNPSYTALSRPTRLLISEKSATYMIKWSCTIIWQVRIMRGQTLFWTP